MSVTFKQSCSAAALLAFSTQMAVADVSAQDVWSDWKAYMVSTGYEITATESTSGGTLTVRDIAMQIYLDDADAGLALTWPEITFTENGDGTVVVDMPGEFPIGFTINDAKEPVAGELMYRQDHNAMVVSGTPDNMRYDFNSSQVVMSLVSLTVDGAPLSDDLFGVSVTLDDVTSKTEMTLNALRNYVQDGSIGALSYNVFFKDPDANEQGAFKGTLNKLAFEGESVVPLGAGETDSSKNLLGGISGKVAMSYDSGNSEIVGVDGSDNFGLESRSDGGQFAFTFDENTLDYALTQNATNLSITSSDVPFPLDLSLAEAGLKLLMPVSASDEEQDFAFGVSLRDFKLPDLVWGMVDPSGVLPRDPATIVLDLAGKGKLLTDLLADDAMAALIVEEKEPGELTALTVKELLVSAAGAALSGTGDFTFNNDDVETFDGLPAPSGVANLQLTGANALLDNLIKMGILSEGDATGARLMMGLLAVPADGDDSLKSKIEISEDGQIRANGQRIK